MNEIEYLTPDDVIALHDEIVGRMGSPHAPLLHRDKLESAVARPRNAAHYEQADLIRQAVLLAVGISQSQAFMDGNKRAAFVAADMFLRINGLAFGGKPLEVAKRLEAVAETTERDAREAAIDQFAVWVQEQVETVAVRGHRS